MIVKDVGKGEPDVAVIGGIHGDEPCGVRSIRTVLSEDLEYNRPARFIIANEKAIEQEVRYIDTDLNRSFAGKKESSKHEEVLAHNLMDKIEDIDHVLALHSTQSTSMPFALTGEEREDNIEMLKKMPITKVVEHDMSNKGDLISEKPGSVEIECGYQWSLQAEQNATTFIKQFLSIHDCISYDMPLVDTRLDVFKLIGAVKKQNKVFFVGNNFEEVHEGQIFGLGENGEIYKAERNFTPVLMSTNGYENIIGYKAIKIKCFL